MTPEDLEKAGVIAEHVLAARTQPTIEGAEILARAVLALRDDCASWRRYADSHRRTADEIVAFFEKIDERVVRETNYKHVCASWAADQIRGGEWRKP